MISIPKMKFYVFLFVLVFLPQGHGGFFSKFMNRRKSESDYVNDENVNVCESVRVMPRIAFAVVGGSPLKFENSAPYITAIGERLSNGSVSWFCGGSLVSPNAILTAAHCLVSRNVTTVRLGSFSTKKRSTENDYEISETIIHPGYKITESYNDIAIVKVKDKISFSRNIKPVCLPLDDKDKYEGERARVIGWGAEEFGGEGSQRLQQVEVEVFTNSNCEKAYSNSTIAPKTFPKGIKKEQLCAGSSKGGKDACQGDSGGPLVLTDSSGTVRQIGIVSTGAGCGFKMYPGVYVRVSSYISWIEENIKNKKVRSAKENSSKGQNTRKENSHSSQYQEYTTKKPTNNNYSAENKKNKNITPVGNNPSSENKEIYSGNGYSSEHRGTTSKNNNENFLARQPQTNSQSAKVPLNYKETQVGSQNGQYAEYNMPQNNQNSQCGESKEINRIQQHSDNYHQQSHYKDFKVDVRIIQPLGNLYSNTLEAKNLRHNPLEEQSQILLQNNNNAQNREAKEMSGVQQHSDDQHQQLQQPENTESQASVQIIQPLGEHYSNALEAGNLRYNPLGEQPQILLQNNQDSQHVESKGINEVQQNSDNQHQHHHQQTEHKEAHVRTQIIHPSNDHQPKTLEAPHEEQFQMNPIRNYVNQSDHQNENIDLHQSPQLNLQEKPVQGENILVGQHINYNETHITSYEQILVLDNGNEFTQPRRIDHVESVQEMTTFITPSEEFQNTSYREQVSTEMSQDHHVSTNQRSSIN